MKTVFFIIYGHLGLYFFHSYSAINLTEISLRDKRLKKKIKDFLEGQEFKKKKKKNHTHTKQTKPNTFANRFCWG